MKKQAIIFLAILLGVYGVLTIMDTSEYRVEKRLWRIQKQYTAIAQDPKSVPAAQYDRLIKKYEALIKKFPESRYVPQMYALMGSLYVMNNEFDQARKTFGHVATQFKDVPDVAARALRDVANVYIIEKKVKQAADVYKRIWDDYPNTEAGFKAPFYLITVYESSGQRALAKQYLEKAAAFYRTMAKDDSRTEAVRLNAHQMLANVYIGQRKWEQTLKVAEAMLNNFADSELMTPVRLREIAKTINLVAVIRLRDFDRARSIYNGFIQKHPEHLLNPYLVKIVEAVGILEEKSSQPSTPQP